MSHIYIKKERSSTRKKKQDSHCARKITLNIATTIEENAERRSDFSSTYHIGFFFYINKYVPAMFFVLLSVNRSLHIATIYTSLYVNTIKEDYLVKIRKYIFRKYICTYLSIINSFLS